MTHTLSVDLETYSPVDLKSAGTYKYAEQAEILLFAYSLDNSPVQCIDLVSDFLPNWLLKALTDPDYKKIAFNAAFERAILNACLKIYTPPEQWECTMVRAAMAGLPLSLDDASKALGLSEKKDATGKLLIRYFSMPCKPTAVNGMRTRNWPDDSPEKWAQFTEYCRQDVVVEQQIYNALVWLKIPVQEKLLWDINERKNERGVKVDLDLISAAMKMDAEYRAELTREAVEITGLKNVNSVSQLKGWLEDETDSDILNLNKQTVNELVGKVDNEKAKRVLEIRQLMSRSSIKKYGAMLNAAGRNARVRGMFQYYGASRTGREAGRLCQPQNFPRIKEDFAEMIDDVRELVKAGDSETLHMVFNNLSDVLAQLLRTTFIAGEGKEFIVLDFSAIEAVCIACMAHETWRVKFFRDGGDIYKASASMMFKTPIGEITKEQRSKGKIAELACGFGGSDGAIERMNDAIEDPKKRIPKKEIPSIAPAWRKANENIVQLWRMTEAAAKNAIRTGEITEVNEYVKFGLKNKNLLMQLPSGRFLVYHNVHFRKFYMAHIPKKVKDEETGEVTVKIENVKVGEVKYQNMTEYYGYLKKLGLKDDGTKPNLIDSICFWGQNQTTKKWEVMDTFGARLVENMVQATARDLLMNGVISIERAGFEVLMTIHDEIVVCVDEGQTTLEEIKKLMLDVPKFAKSWPVRADGFVSKYYEK